MTTSDNDARPVPKRRREAPAQPDPMAPTGAPSRPTEAAQAQPVQAQPAGIAATTAAGAVRLAPVPVAQEQGEVPIYLRVSPLVKSEFKELHTALGITGKELFQLMVKESRARYARTGTI